MTSEKSAPENTFEQLSEHFQNKIYNSRKGQIRLDLLQRDLAPIRDTPPTMVLDAGGGLGHMSRWFAEKGHQITLFDSAKNMLDAAAALNDEAELSELFTLSQANINQFTSRYDGSGFDLILCHAVLEWLEQPEQAIAQLTSLLNEGGHLSLMFYNQHSLILKNALRGNLRKVKSGNWRGDGIGLTPYQALFPEAVYGWLDKQQLSIELTSGIRCFYDYLPKNVRDTYELEDLLDLERDHYRKDPYVHMARYIHVLAKKNSK